MLRRVKPVEAKSSLKLLHVNFKQGGMSNFWNWRKFPSELVLSCEMSWVSVLRVPSADGRVAASEASVPNVEGTAASEPRVASLPSDTDSVVLYPVYPV